MSHSRQKVFAHIRSFYYITSIELRNGLLYEQDTSRTNTQHGRIGTLCSYL